MVGLYLAMSFCLSLRGNEGFMLDLQGLIQHIMDGRDRREKHPHVVFPLLGRFKNEVGERWHLMLSVPVTKSGFKVRMWTERLVKLMLKENKVNGPAICRPDGHLYESGAINSEFKASLAKIQESHPHLIKENVDVFEVYNIRRSLRRGSSSTAREEGVKPDTIDLINR